MSCIGPQLLEIAERLIIAIEHFSQLTQLALISIIAEILNIQ